LPNQKFSVCRKIKVGRQKITPKNESCIMTALERRKGVHPRLHAATVAFAVYGALLVAGQWQDCL